MSIRDKLLGQAKAWQPTFEQAEIPGVGTVWLKKLTAGERDKFDPAYRDGGSRVMILLHCCFDERGMRIFQDEDVGLLEQLDPDLIDPICIHALRLNNLTKAAQEQIVKNSNGQAVNSS